MTNLTLGKQRPDRRDATQAQSASAPARAPSRDDNAMLRAAANLTRDLNLPSARIYWADMIGSALLGYAALLTAMVIPSAGLALAAALVAVLALYRAGSFIHELTHIKKGDAWLPPGLEPACRHSLAGPVVHVRRRP